MSGNGLLRNGPKPHYQGALDGLCGVYATVNAITLLLGSSKSADHLFRSLCIYLDRRGELGRILTEGSWFRQFCRIVDTASEWLLTHHDQHLTRRVASRHARVELDTFWSTLSDHLEENGPGSVLLGMSGVYDHWTCVHRITDGRIFLFDSSRIKILNRSSCTTGSARSSRPHELWPRQTLLITLK
jgi:hypothetical protein